MRTHHSLKCALASRSVPKARLGVSRRIDIGLRTKTHEAVERNLATRTTFQNSAKKTSQKLTSTVRIDNLNQMIRKSLDNTHTGA